MYSTLRSSLFFKTKITTNHTAIYRKKKKRSTKRSAKMTVFSLQTRPSNPPKRRLCFFSNRSSTSHKQKLHQPPTEAPPTTNRAFVPSPLLPRLHERRKKQPFAHRGTLYSSTPVRTEPHPLRIAQERRTFTEI